MAFFKFNKPRGFHHNFMYYDERKDLLNNIKNKYSNNKTNEQNEGNKNVEKRIREINFKANKNSNQSFATSPSLFSIAIITIVIFALLYFLFYR